MKLSPRNKLILVAAVFALLVIVAIVVLIVPVVTKMGQLDENVAAAEQQQSAAQTLLDRRKEVRDRAVQNDAALLQLAVALPDSPELPSLLVELQDQAYEDDVLIRRIEPLPPVQLAEKPYVEMSLNVIIWGEWDDTVDYLQSLQDTSRLIRVNEFRSELIEEQTRLDKEPDLEDYSVQTTMKITAYVLPASDASGTAPVAPAQPQQ